MIYTNKAHGAEMEVWKDWPTNDNLEVPRYLIENKIMFGYEDGNFHPWRPVTEKQVIRTCKRAGIRTDLDENDYSDDPAYMGWIEEHFLPGTVKTARKEESCNRFRLAVMLYRYGMNPGPSSIPEKLGHVARILDDWFAQTKVTWNGVTRTTRLVGLGRLFVDEHLEHNVPLWLALGQCWRESQWFTTGLSVKYNCGWGIKASPEKWGLLGDPPIVSGYGNYKTVDEAVRAYFKYMDQQVDSRTGKPLYRDLIDHIDEGTNLRKILNIYAPAFENDTEEHYRIVTTVRRWCQERGINI